MAQLIFGNTINMLTIATPSSGYIVGYDLDGVLKQKDVSGNIVEVGGGLSTTATSSLSNVLSIGNNSGLYSIVMGTSTSINSANGGGQISLDYGGLPNHIYISSDGGLLQQAVLEVSEHYSGLAAQNYFLGFESYDLAGERATNIWSTFTSSIVNIGVSRTYYATYEQYQDISVHENTTSVSVSDYNRHAIFIGTRNSLFAAGITNSVIIGGYGLYATQSNTVYLGNYVNINYAYTLPNVDGTSNQVLKTDGAGNVTWQNDSDSNKSLSQILSVGNTSSGYDVIISDGDVIQSYNNNSVIDFSSGTKVLSQFSDGATGLAFVDLNSSQSKVSFKNPINLQGGYIDITETSTEIGHTSSISIVGTSVVLGKSSTTTTPLTFKNSTNSNSVSIQSGITTVDYTLTLPTSQGNANTVLKNDGSGILSWVTSSNTLFDILQIGNTTSTDIVLGPGHYIKSLTTSPYTSEMTVQGGSNPVFIVNNDSGGLNKSWIYGDIDSLDLGFNDNTLIASDSKIELNSTTGSISSKITVDSINSKTYLGVRDSSKPTNDADSIQVLANWTSANTVNSNNKFPSAISTKNATFSQFVDNSVIIGGSGLVATLSDTVYLGNNVNINNAYTLPNTDGNNGYVLKTDGAGNVSWQSDSAGITPSLSQTLLTGNTTGTSSLNFENFVSFDGQGLTTLIDNYSIASPLAGFQYRVSGDLTTSIYSGAKVMVDDTFNGLNDGEFIITNATFSSPYTYFQWSSIASAVSAGPSYGVITYGIEKGYLQLDVATTSNYYTLPNKSGTIALLSDVQSSGVIGPAEDGNYTDGIFTDFTPSTPIGTAVDRFNEVLLLLAPTPPSNWNNAITSISFTNTSYTARALTSGSSVTIYTTLTPTITCTDIVGSQSNARVNTTGLTFSLVNNGVQLDSATLNGSSTPAKTTNYLRHSGSVDPYNGVSGKSGFWQGITDFFITGNLPSVSASSSLRTMLLYHPGTDSPETFNYYIDTPLTVSIGTITATVPAMTSYISGVPTLTTSNTITSIAFSITNVASYFWAATSVWAINAGHVAGSTGNPDVTPTSYAETGNVTGKSAAVASGQFSDLSFFFTVKGRNSIGTYGADTLFTSTSHRIDTVSNESSRLTSGAGSYPGSGYGFTYDSTQSLVATYTDELQLRNGIYVYPTVNYTAVGGPNYSGASGTRWATFNIGTFTNNSAFTLNINGSSGISTSTGVAGLLVEVKIESSSLWVDGDSAYSGVGSPGTGSDGIAAVVVGSSTATSRRITFGSTTHTGSIIVRIGLTGTGIQFTSVTATSIV